MQFIESSMLGVRSARLSFARGGSAVRVTLFPMIHIGEPDFYDATYKDALSHDVVLIEGVRSPVVLRITRSYRWLIGSKAMAGLVVQPPIAVEGADARMVLADLSREEFEREWRDVPLWQRVVLYLLAPVVGLRRRYVSRARLAKDMSCDDQPSLSEMLAMTPETGALTSAMLDARDRRLLQKLNAEIDAASETSLRVAIVYGALHMRAVARELRETRGFVVQDGEWRMIFGLE